MKEKILSALETAVKNTAKSASPITLSKKTLDAYAEMLSGTITDEATIDAEIQKVLPMLSVLQGDLNHQISTAVKKAAIPAAQEPPKTDQPADQPDLVKTIQETFAAMFAPLQEKLANIEKQKSTESKLSVVKENLAKEFKLKDSWRDEALKNIAITDEMDEKQITTAVVGEYNRLATLFGLSGAAIPAQQAVGGTGGDFKDYVAQLQKEGKLENV